MSSTAFGSTEHPFHNYHCDLKIAGAVIDTERCSNGEIRMKMNLNKEFFFKFLFEVAILFAFLFLHGLDRLHIRFLGS